jgi:hypothetical protein
MKKITVVCLVIILSTGVSAQMRSSAIKLGHYSPSAASGGFIIGYEGGIFSDEMLSFGWSLDWFHQNYVDRKLIEDYNALYGIPGSSTNELRAKTNIHDFPAMISATIKYPVTYFTKVFFTGGIGAELLLINYRNFVNPSEDEFQTAFDFNWRLGFGGLYELSRNSEVFLEFIYHSSQPGWEYEINDPGSGIDKTYERVFDMSGIMARVGFRFYY